MTTIGHKSLDQGGMCYVACQEAFEWWNSSVTWCNKGCDIGMGRQQDPLLREQSKKMCQMLASSNYAVSDHEDLDNMDLRIHATMYSNNAGNLYKACMAGVRRQRH